MEKPANLQIKRIGELTDKILCAKTVLSYPNLE